MAVGLIGIVADGLKTEHSDDVLIFFPAVFGVGHTSHLAGLEEWRLFVGKEDEAQCLVGFFVCEVSCEGKRCCNGRAVIVCAGAAIDGVIMGADDYNLLGLFCCCDFSFEVAASFVLHLIVLSSDFVAGFGEGGF